MTVYLVNRDLPGIAVEDLAAAQKKAIETAAEFRTAGKPINYIRSLFIADDSRCMCLFDAEDPTTVAELNDTAGIPYTGITEALDLTP